MSAFSRSTRIVFLLFNVVCLSLVAFRAVAVAQDAPASAEAVEIAGAEGKLKFTVPGTWKAKQPSVRIIEHEFSSPAAEGADAPGRLTMMAAGGSVKANVDRWKGQFQAEGDGPTFKTEDLKVAGQAVNLIDLSGTYLDRRGPFGPATPKPDYRMLGAIIEVPGGGLYFLKYYGPKATLDAHEDEFLGIVKGMQVP